MIRYRIRHLPVTRPDSTLIGIVSDRDIRSAMPSKYFHDHGIKEMEAERATGVAVQEIMTKDPISVSLSSTLQDALLLIEKTRVGAFPVVDENLKVMGNCPGELHTPELLPTHVPVRYRQQNAGLYVDILSTITVI